RHAANAGDRAGDLLGLALVGRAADLSWDLLAHALAARHTPLFAADVRAPDFLGDHLRAAAIAIAIVFAAILVLLLAQAAEETGPRLGIHAFPTALVVAAIDLHGDRLRLGNGLPAGLH